MATGDGSPTHRLVLQRRSWMYAGLSRYTLCANVFEITARKLQRSMQLRSYIFTMITFSTNEAEKHILNDTSAVGQRS